MNRERKGLVLTFVLLAALLSCAKKQEIIPIPEMQRYDDPYERFSVMYPGNWVMQPDAKRATFYSSEDAKSRFIDPTSTGPLGAAMTIAIAPQDTLVDVEQAVQGSKDEIQGATIEADQSITFSDRPAVMYGYSYYVDEKTRLRGYKVFALADSTLYRFEAEGFNERFDAYRTIMDSTFRTIRLFRPKTAATFSTGPSTTLASYSSDHFEMEYPDNFESNFPQKKKETIELVEFKGYRQDCTIRVEVVPAKKNPLNKVFDAYKASYEAGGQYRVKRTAQMTVGGEQVLYLDLSARKFEVDSRAYFAVKNDRIYYVFLSWYRPQTNVYVPVFDNCVNSLKIKA